MRQKPTNSRESRRALPPLNAVRAFEAAARQGCFARAAAELCVTPGAISQQVKTLELALDQRLFERLSRSVTLTEAGRTYLCRVSCALDELAAATAELRPSPGTALLRITCVAAFAEKWLVRCLTRFQAQHPNIEVELSPGSDSIDFARTQFDLGIRFSDGHHPDLGTDLLFGERLSPVCSPDLRFQEPRDLRDHVLLHDRTWRQDWPLWLKGAGITDICGDRGPIFGLYNMAIEAAAEGCGIAMGREFLLADDIAAGRLVNPFPLRVEAPHAYYLLWPPRHASRLAVRVFRAWIAAEAVAWRARLLRQSTAINRLELRQPG